MQGQRLSLASDPRRSAVPPDDDYPMRFGAGDSGSTCNEWRADARSCMKDSAVAARTAMLRQDAHQLTDSMHGPHVLHLACGTWLLCEISRWPSACGGAQPASNSAAPLAMPHRLNASEELMQRRTPHGSRELVTHTTENATHDYANTSGGRAAAMRGGLISNQVSAGVAEYSLLDQSHQTLAGSYEAGRPGATLNALATRKEASGTMCTRRTAPTVRAVRRSAVLAARRAPAMALHLALRRLLSWVSAAN